ncbi:hypothetical protein L0337_35500 [candidate division KSB1 bacterium]|nr:hypothetical protein [candidate division KSB1 bacterium]
MNFDRNSLCFHVGLSKPSYAKAARAAQKSAAYEQMAEALKSLFFTAKSAVRENSFARPKISFGVKCAIIPSSKFLNANIAEKTKIVNLKNFLNFHLASSIEKPYF